MDKGDELLAEALRQELRDSGRKMASSLDDEADEGGAFFEALEAFRAARRSGDKARTAAAERALQDVVRSEMARDEGCGL